VNNKSLLSNFLLQDIIVYNMVITPANNISKLFDFLLKLIFLALTNGQMCCGVGFVSVRIQDPRDAASALHERL
jgi:hypothetical protein